MHRGGSAGESVPGDVSSLLAWSDGDQLYDELRRLAHHYMKRERAGHSLQTTGLVNEAYLRLLGYRRMRWEDRTQFPVVSLRVSSITVMREWKSARAWLYRELAGPTANGH